MLPLFIQMVRCHGVTRWPIFNPKQNFKNGSNFVNFSVNIYLLLMKIQNYTERSEEIAYSTPIDGAWVSTVVKALCY